MMNGLSSSDCIQNISINSYQMQVYMISFNVRLILMLKKQNDINERLVR